MKNLTILKNKYIWLIFLVASIFYLASKKNEADIYRKLKGTLWIVMCYNGSYHDSHSSMDIYFPNEEGYFDTGISKLKIDNSSLYHRFTLEIQHDSVFIDFGADTRFLKKYYVQQSACLLGHNGFPNYLYLIGKNESFVLHRMQLEKEMKNENCSLTPEMLDFVEKCEAFPYGKFDLNKGCRGLD